MNGQDNKLIIEENTKLYDCSIYAKGNNNFIYIGKNCKLQGTYIMCMDDDNSITLNDNCTTNGEFWGDVHLHTMESTHIKLGCDCMLSGNITIRTTDGHSIINNEGKRINMSKDIEIGDHVWIGMNCIVGANSVVTKQFDDEYKIIVGNPAIAKNPKFPIDWKREKKLSFNSEDFRKQVVIMKIDPKMLVSDYDQTFYLNDEDIEKNKQAVAKFRKAGNIFVIATGRSYLDFFNKLEIYNFEYDYLIINHGATILDADNNILANFPMNNEIISKLKNDLQLNKALDNFCCSKLKSRVDFDHKDLTKINIKYKNKEIASSINLNINKNYSDYVNSYHVADKLIEIIAAQTNKSYAINLLSKKLNLPKKTIYTIGDGYSDINMIKEFNGFAMKNSVEELKKLDIKKYDSVSELIYDITEEKS